MVLQDRLTWSQVFVKRQALATTKVYWARRRGEHNRLERTAQTRAEGGGGGGGEEAGGLGPVRSAAGGGRHPPLGLAAGMSFGVQGG